MELEIHQIFWSKYPFFPLKTIIIFSLTLNLTPTLHPRRTLVRKLNVVSRKNNTNLEALAGFLQDERD